MRTKLLLLTTVIVVFASLGTINTSSRRQSAESSADDVGTIAWHIRLAEEKGQKTVNIPPLTGIPEEIGGLDQALTRFRVILAEPVDTHTYVSGRWTLLTWYRFRVLEDLSSPAVRPCSGCDSGDGIPSDLLPVGPSEILVPQPGGVLTINGLTLVQKSAVPLDAAIGSWVADNPDELSEASGGAVARAHKRIIRSSRPFLLFVSPSESRMVGRLSLGPRGVFEVNPDGTLETIDGKPNVMSNHFREANIVSFDEFKAHAQRLQKIK